MENKEKKLFAKAIVLSLSMSFILCGCKKGGADVYIKPSLSLASSFNDEDSDGLGEFQGFGTSLCWWANRLGYSEALTKQSAEAFFDKEKGLSLSIGRYNIGGGDYVYEGDIDSVKNPGPYLHEAHIKRSDSIVPGYCIDVTKIDLDEHDKEYYENNFDRADFSCGFSWNYNWDADENQRNILNAAIQAYGDDFIVEAFSNSPPYFMTVSGCSSGNENSKEDNLREDSYEAFAAYLSDVINHYNNEGVFTFQSVEPMNEPGTDYWSFGSEKQEGCHFTPGESQSKMILSLNEELKKSGTDIIITASDETGVKETIRSYNKLSDDAKNALSRVDTHAYNEKGREKLRTLLESEGKNLWMSEVDNTYSLGKSNTGMEAALGFSDEIIKDLSELRPSAWIMWNAVDMQVDSKNEFDTLTREEADEIMSSGTPFWGIAIADHDKEELLIGKKYYAFGQFTRYIKPGYTIISSGKNSVAAYDKDSGTIVLVCMNEKKKDLSCRIDLSEFSSLIKDADIFSEMARPAASSALRLMR